MDTALRTDRYELTMLSSLVESGMAARPAVFELFARRLPPGRRYGMLAGLGRLLDSLHDFRFGDDTIAWLRDTGALTAAGARWLGGWTFTGDLDGYREGETYWPGSPVLTVRGRLGDAILLETLALSVFNHDTAIASAASRMVTASAGRPIIEMGSRRVHEDAAPSVARAAYIAGFASTSNLAAGRRYGVPTVGTAAHAFTLAHASESEAFDHQLATFGAHTTLLVDTYDTEQGIRNAVAAANRIGASGPGAIRLDSGDLLVEATRARALLDSLGAYPTRVTVTSDLDEYVMTDLAGAPIDGYGAGTRVATGSGHPTAGMVYKLVAVGDSDDATVLRPVAKKASGKASVGGTKTVHRHDDGTEHYRTDGLVPEHAHPVQVALVRGGHVVHTPSLDEVRETAANAVAALPDVALSVADGLAHFTSIHQESPE